MSYVSKKFIGCDSDLRQSDRAETKTTSTTARLEQ